MGRIQRLFASLGLAIDIVRGSLRLLRKYPKLIVPILPVFLMVILLEIGLLLTNNPVVQLILIFIVAFELMFSFVITSTMLQQIHAGQQPALGQAISAPRTLQLIPKVFVLSLIWFTVILLLVALEMTINAFLDRDGSGDGFLSAIFGTIADALRMMGFMLIPIMIFENIGLREAFRRLRTTLADSPVTALGGLALTKAVTVIIFLAIQGLTQLGIPSGFLGFVLVLALSGAGWILAIYLEQLFVTGLYLYAAFPESEVMGILLEKQLGGALPEIPTPDTGALPALP